MSINSGLVRGNSLQLGGPQFGYGPPYIPATPSQCVLWDSAPGVKDASLDVHGGLTVRSDMTVSGNTTMTLAAVSDLKVDVLEAFTLGGDIQALSHIKGLTPTLPDHLTTKAFVESLVASNFTGNLASTIQGFLSDGIGAVRVRDDQGLSVSNSAGAEGHRLRTMTGQTTNATAVELTAGPGQYLTVAPGEIHSYTIMITGKGTAGTNTGKASYAKIEFLAANAAGTVTVEGGVLYTLIGQHAGISWSVDAVADSPNGRVAIMVTGETGNTISWVGRVSETAL